MLRLYCRQGYCVWGWAISTALVAGARLVAHELTHVVQTAHISGTSATSKSNQEIELKLTKRPMQSWSEILSIQAYYRISRPSAAVDAHPLQSLAPYIGIRAAFNNAGAPEANNCAINLPAARRSGCVPEATVTPWRHAQLERFWIHSAIPGLGIEFDGIITRTGLPVLAGRWWSMGSE